MNQEIFPFSLSESGTYKVTLYKNIGQFLIKPDRSGISLPQCTISQSILAFTGSNSERQLIEFSSLPGCSSLDGAQGKMATVVFANGERASGRLASSNGHGSPIVLVKDEEPTMFHLYKEYDSVHVEAERIKPAIVLKTDEGALATTMVSLMNDGVSWKTFYNAFIQEDTISCLSANAIVTNDTKEALTPDSLTFVVGSAYSTNRPRGSVRKSYAKSLGGGECYEAPNDQPIRSDLGEYEQYVISKPGPVPAGESSVFLFKMEFQDQKKIYCASLERSETLNWGFRVTAPRYLPHGKIAFYDPEPVCLGETTIPATASGKTFDVLVGSPNKISFTCTASTNENKVGADFGEEVERKVKRAKPLTNVICVTTYTARVNNLSEKELTILLQLRKPQGYAKVTFGAEPNSTSPTGMLEWAHVAPIGKSESVIVVKTKRME